MERILELMGGNGDKNIQAISDAYDAEDLQLQEVLEASMANFQISQHENVPSFVVGDEEAGESSRKYCEICMETKESDDDMFQFESCSHCFCSDCIVKHIQAKIEEKIHTITCPTVNCNYIIEPFLCKAIIPENVFARWEEAWNEASILDSEKFYCPFKDCSAMLVNDTEEEIIKESECPECRRLFCARCRVPWHCEIECEEFQKLKADERGRDDLMLHVLAKENKWINCPNCNFLVDKTEGCIHMTCRCGFEFCYECGVNWSPSHWSCQQ